MFVLFRNRIIRRFLFRLYVQFNMCSILDSTLQKYLNKGATSDVFYIEPSVPKIERFERRKKITK